MKQILAIGWLILCAASATASAQNIEVDPLQCWWRTSAGAVRVGEPFSVVLTCATVEAPTLTVVPDQGPLEPSAIQLAPFEVMSGARHADLHADNRRFFQYQYRLRVINEDFFGKDVAVPELKLTYRVRSQVNGASIDGMERSYLIPSLSVRVLSLVPGGALDIRDQTTNTFGDIEAKLFRANLLTSVGGVLFVLAALVALVAIVGAFNHLRGRRPEAAHAVDEADILRSVRAEVARIARERTANGWTPVLAAQLLTTLRIVAAIAVSKPANQLIAKIAGAPDGYLLVRSGWAGGTKTAISSSATPLDVSRALAAVPSLAPNAAALERGSMLENLQRVLARLTSSRYGREAWQESTASEALDDALEVERQVVRRLSLDQIWPVRTFRAASRATDGFRQRVWSR